MTAMTLERFRELAEAWGGALARWPAAEREAAAALLQRSAAARAILHEAAGVDALLAMDGVAAAPEGLRNAIVVRGVELVQAGVAHGEVAAHRLRRTLTPTPLPGGEELVPGEAGANGRGLFGFLRHLWMELGGLRVAGPAFAASLALGIGVASMIDAPVASDDQPGYGELALLATDYESYLP